MGCCQTKSSLRQSAPRTITPDPASTDINSLTQSYDCQAAFGQDSLQEVDKNDMSKRLHKNLGALIFTSTINQRFGKGTGLLISPDLVLTCAHNLYNKQTGQLYRDFQFYPGQYGKLKDYVTVDDFYFPSKYHLSRLPAYEYALLKLSQKVQTTDFIELGCKASILKNSDTVLSIYGYPQTAYSSYKSDRLVTTQFGMTKKDRVVEVKQDQGELFHRLSTVRGMSGAPIIYQDPTGKMCVVGIHVGAMVSRVDGVKKRVNVGRLITFQLVEILKKAVTNLSAVMFQAEEKQLPANDSTIDMKVNNLFDETGQFPINQSQLQTKETKPTAKNPELIDQLFKQAYSLYFDGKLSETIQKYRKVIKLDPTNAAAYHNLALALNDEKEYQQAVACYQKAIEIDPKYSSAYNNLGTTYDQMKQTQKAISCYRKAIESDPRSAKAYNNIASAYRDIKQFNQAVVNYRKALELDKNYSKAQKNLQGVLNTIDEISQIKQKIGFLEATLERNSQNLHAKKRLPELREKLKLITK